MLPNTNRQNATSVPPASAEGNPQTGAARPTGTGPLPVSALAEALENSGAFADPTDTQVQPGSQEPGAGAPSAGVEPVDNGAATGAETPPESGSEPIVEDDLPLLDEPVTAGASTNGTGETEPQDHAGYKKRIDRLTADNRRLQAELAEARNAPPAAPQAQAGPGDGLQALDTIEAVDNFSSLAVRAIDAVADMLERLNDEPGAVEQFIRDNKGVLVDDQGQEDYSPKRMRAWLQSKRAIVRDQLRFVPQRRAVLQQKQAAHKQLVQFFPFLDDKTDPRYAKVHELYRQFPGVQNLPNSEWACLCFMEGEKSLRAKLQARAKLQPGNTNGARKVAPPNTAGGAPPPSRGTKSQVDQAKDAVRKGGGKEALASLFEATNFAKG